MLIEKNSNGNWRVEGILWEDLHTGKKITKEMSEILYDCLHRLMEYESTGLDPGQVESMKESLGADEVDAIAAEESEQEEQRKTPDFETEYDPDDICRIEDDNLSGECQHYCMGLCGASIYDRCPFDE